ncbi:MAG: hypothetical protein Q7S60_00045 [bacterium]|nr:hypothetical protein [bacterium]
MDPLGKISKIKKILVSVTTTRTSDWKGKIKEIKELGLKEIAIFPTCLSGSQRKELYLLLEASGVKSIPYCHLRNDMKVEELDYLTEKYNVQAFSTHMGVEYPFLYDWSKYEKIVYIENVFHTLDEKEINDFGGICLDISHLENDRIFSPEKFRRNVEIIEKKYIGANHVSSVKNFSKIDEMGAVRYDCHNFQELSEFDYLKRYPLSYFSSFIAIEAENSIKEQLKAREYIINLLGR